MTCCRSALPVVATLENGMHSNSDGNADEGHQKAAFMVPAMHCAACIRKLETGLTSLDFVERARANLSTRQVEVEWRGGEGQQGRIAEHIQSLGFESQPVDPETDGDDELRRQGRHLLFCLAVAGFASANIMLLSVSVWSGAEAETARLFGLISGLIAVPAIFFAGSPFFSSAFKALSARQLNMDVPISLAVLLSLFMSLYEALIGGGETFFDAGVMLLFFLLIGRTLDHLMREKAASGVKSLARLIPRIVTRIEDDGSLVPANLETVTSGMLLRLLPGDRFPVDARIIEGQSAADRSIVTGEAGEIPIRTGDVFEAGTLNLRSVIDVEAVSDSQTSFLAEVMEMMKAAETSKGRYRRIADRMAAVYAPAVHILALATFIGWIVVVGEVKPSLTAAVAVLIITCPCALGLAVPVTHVVAANRLFREGILMRDGSALERLAEVDAVFFDKTGTLTSDQLQLEEPPQLDKSEAAVLKGLAGSSRHPVAQAIANALGSVKGVQVAGVTEVPGFGVEAAWNGKRVRLGRSEWVAELPGIDSPPDLSPTAFAIEGESSEGFHLTSYLKPGAKEAVADILQHGYEAAILSGDHESNVQDVACKTGIANWHAGLKPQQKIMKIRGAQADHKALMVGDGLNDAPSLAAAHVSMAPANAADVSRASADFVFTRPSLAAVPFAMKLSKAANRIVRQNFALAILYNCIAVPLAITGHVTPLVAAIAMSLSSIIVVSNSMRLALFDQRPKTLPNNRPAHAQSHSPAPREMPA